MKYRNKYIVFFLYIEKCLGIKYYVIILCSYYIHRIFTKFLILLTAIKADIVVIVVRFPLYPYQ